MGEFAPLISDQLLLDAIVQDPDCLETGLRLLETDRTPDKKACVASGFDRSGRPVVLYVTGDVIDVADVEAGLSYASGCRNDRSRSRRGRRLSRRLELQSSNAALSKAESSTLLDEAAHEERMSQSFWRFG